MSYILKSILISLLLFAINLHSQSTIYTADLDSITVSITRKSDQLKIIPFAVNRLDSNLFSNLNNENSVQEILNTIPGVIAKNRFNPAQDDKITIRGIGSRAQFGSRGIKIILDNIPLTFPDGQSQLNNLNPSTIREIEIIRGPASTLYGNASGGVISIKSKQTDNEDLLIYPSFKYGSFDYQKYSLSISGRLLNGYSDFNIFTSSSNGYRYHSNSRMTGFNFLTNHSITQNLFITGIVNYFNAPYLLNPGSLNKIDALTNPKKVRNIILTSGSGKKVEQFQTGITFNYLPYNNFEINSTLYGIKRNLLNPITSRIIDLNRWSYGVRTNAVVKQNILKADVKFLIGFDYEVQDDLRIEFENNGLPDNQTYNPNEMFDKIIYGNKLLNQKEIVRSSGIFFQTDIALFNRLNVSFGIRYDHFSFKAKDNFLIDRDDSGVSKMDEFSPMIGAGFNLFENTFIYSNYSTAFQTPTTNELSNKEDGSGGFNLALKPEYIGSIELGLRGEIDYLLINYDFTYYKMFINNMILQYQNQFEESYYKNSGKINSDGFEILVKWNPSQFAGSIFSYTYQNMKFEDYVVQNGNDIIQLKGNYLPGIPVHYFNYRLISNLSKALTLQLNLTSQSKLYTNDFNGPSPESNENSDSFINDGFTIVSINLDYKINLPFGSTGISFGVDNLFNKKYNNSIVPNAFGNNFYEPSPGRTFFAGISF